MAVYHEKFDPMSSRSASLGGALGGAVASGISGLLQGLAKRKKQDRENENIAGALSSMKIPGLTPDIAKQISVMPEKTKAQVVSHIFTEFRQDKMQKQRQALQMQKEGMTPGQPSQNKQRKRIMANKSAHGISKRIKEYIKQGKGIPENMKRLLKNRGFTDEDLGVIASSSEMTPEIASYFLRIASGDEYKAKKIARKYGFDVPLEKY